MNTIQYRDGGSLAKENKEMLMNQAIELKHHADELMKVLEKSNYIEPWVLSKAERATTDLSDITHYLEGNSKKMQYGGYMEEGGEVSEFNLEGFLNFIYPNVNKIMDSNNISIDKEFIVSMDMQIAYVPHFMYEYEGNKVSELAIYYFDAQDKHIGHIEIDLEEKEIEVEFPSWGLDDEDKYERGGYMEEGGVIEDKINKLYTKSNFINDDFNWKLKLLEMLQDRSIEAYNIYQSLSESQKELVLQELFEMDNDMGSEGDGEVETSKENLDILLEDAESGKYYEISDYMAKGGETKDEYVVYIKFRNAKKKFNVDTKYFRGDNAYQDAVKWGRKNLSNFNMDMVKHEMADGGMMAKGDNTTLIKEAVDFVRQQKKIKAKREEKIKWFDNLPLTEKQDLFYSYKGRKISISQYLKDADKVAIWNKIHNGEYSEYAKGGEVKFADKVKSISKRLNRTQVSRRYQSEYGERYNKKESELAASRIAGAMIKKGY